MERTEATAWSLGDLRDIRAHVTRVARRLTRNEDEVQELIGDGLELVSRRFCELPPGASLGEALGGWLERRLRDRWRERHPEWRRNTRAATSYSLAATGLAWEHGDALGQLPVTREPGDVAESRIGLAAFEQEADLRDPSKVGQYLGQPSSRPLPTVTAREVWELIVDEREGNGPSRAPAFLFLRSL